MIDSVIKGAFQRYNHTLLQAFQPSFICRVLSHYIRKTLFLVKSVSHSVENFFFTFKMVVDCAFAQVSERIDDILNRGGFIAFFHK
ncbi:hypothetical protein SDC9_135009 [bioreactor metagenome]|uniref:Uncharacterized protein n=1 Tax=bioreactor metagenome TaxID=1076179 RepID=A0A645DFU7_9ZZZZ